MLLSRIFEHLAYNTLSQLSVGGTDIGGVSIDNYPRLITLVNAGLVDLYTQFPLRTRDLTLQLQEAQNIYPLTSAYAESNTGSIEVKYILDGTSIYKFTDNILSIDNVYNEIGEEVPLNNLNEPLSVFTPSVTELQVPYLERENMLSLVYRATPDIIDLSLLDPTLEEVDLPYHFMDAITSYVAWKMYTPIDSAENPKALSHQSQYISAINLIKQTGSSIEDTFTNNRFEVNGWL